MVDKVHVYASFALGAVFGSIVMLGVIPSRNEIIRAAWEDYSVVELAYGAYARASEGAQGHGRDP